MRPLVPVFLSFLSGIVLSRKLGLSSKAPYIIFAVSLSLLPLIFLFFKNLKFRSIAVLPPFFLLGSLYILPYINPPVPPDSIANFVDEREPETAYGGEAFGPLGRAIEGVVLYSPEEAGERIRLHVDAKRIYMDGGWRSTSGGVLLTVQAKRLDIKKGDRIRFLAHIREPRNYGNPGEFDYRESLKLKGISAVGYIRNERLIVKTGEDAPEFGGLIEGFRKRIGDTIEASGAKNREALKALIIACKGGIGPDVKEAFVKTGTAHILAISGLHVGMVALFSYNLFVFLLKRSERVMLAIDIKKAALAVSVVPIFAYGLLAGFPVSTQRAVMMVSVFVFTFLINRGKDFFNTLALAGLAVLVISPASVWDASFQLTFAAVFSIVYFAPRFEEFLEKKEEVKLNEEEGIIKRVFRKRIRPAILVTLAASLGTSPILAYHFHQVSIFGLAANLLAIPLTGLIVPLLLVSSSLLPVSEGLSKVFIGLSDVTFEAMLEIIRFFAALPYSSVWVATPSFFELFLFYIFVICLSNIKRERFYRYLAPAILLISLLDWGYWNYYKKDEGLLKVTFISVGQGESELVELPDGKTMLIDGGGLFNTDFDIGEKVIAPFLWHRNIKKIDYVVLSHAQRDHMGGLKFITENFRVKEFWYNGEGELGRLKEALSRQRVNVRIIDGSSGKFTAGGATVEPLHPSKELSLDPNNMCLVIRLTYLDVSFLFTGDIGGPAEAELVKRDIRAAVLKSPHHGSRYSSTEEFLKAVNPSFIVISAGRWNSFGFPHKETLERYDGTGAKVFRTDIDGAVTITTDGKEVRTATYLTEGAL